ncbi:YndM family protein [Terribacillus sp. DMT04]|uniref:YndM family protein n=1 Tax=Terribacillus sp. DMT04 TaxID=2850441 RepID=UPI001C2CB16B|nr:YndM family protein [Terribacillus sp. DMT04]QXE03199.1 YndM family protein [Terribacillus sp. DMT04]
MKHVKALVIKFIMILAVLTIIFTLMFNVEFSDTLLISAILTVAAYIIGDLFILSRAGDRSKSGGDYMKRNIMATISDAILTFFVLWVLGELLLNPGNLVILASLISAFVIGLGEWFFHRYVNNRVIKDRNAQTVGMF